MFLHPDAPNTRHKHASNHGSIIHDHTGMMIQLVLRRRGLGLLSQRGAPAAAFGSKGGSISVDLSKAFDTHSTYYLLATRAE